MLRCGRAACHPRTAPRRGARAVSAAAFGDDFAARLSANRGAGIRDATRDPVQTTGGQHAMPTTRLGVKVHEDDTLGQALLMYGLGLDCNLENGRDKTPATLPRVTDINETNMVKIVHDAIEPLRLGSGGRTAVNPYPHTADVLEALREERAGSLRVDPVVASARRRRDVLPAEAVVSDASLLKDAAAEERVRQLAAARAGGGGAVAARRARRPEDTLSARWRVQMLDSIEEPAPAVVCGGGSPLRGKLAAHEARMREEFPTAAPADGASAERMKVYEDDKQRFAGVLGCIKAAVAGRGATMAGAARSAPPKTETGAAPAAPGGVSSSLASIRSALFPGRARGAERSVSSEATSVEPAAIAGASAEPSRPAEPTVSDIDVVVGGGGQSMEEVSTAPHAAKDATHGPASAAASPTQTVGGAAPTLDLSGLTRVARGGTKARGGAGDARIAEDKQDAVPASAKCGPQVDSSSEPSNNSNNSTTLTARAAQVKDASAAEAVKPVPKLDLSMLLRPAGGAAPVKTAAPVTAGAAAGSDESKQATAAGAARDGGVDNGSMDIHVPHTPLASDSSPQSTTAAPVGAAAAALGPAFAKIAAATAPPSASSPWPAAVDAEGDRQVQGADVANVVQTMRKVPSAQESVKVDGRCAGGSSTTDGARTAESPAQPKAAAAAGAATALGAAFAKIVAGTALETRSRSSKERGEEVKEHTNGAETGDRVCVQNTIVKAEGEQKVNEMKTEGGSMHVQGDASAEENGVAAGEDDLATSKHALAAAMSESHKLAMPASLDAPALDSDVRLTTAAATAAALGAAFAKIPTAAATEKEKMGVIDTRAANEHTKSADDSSAGQAPEKASAVSGCVRMDGNSVGGLPITAAHAADSPVQPTATALSAAFAKMLRAVPPRSDEKRGDEAATVDAEGDKENGTKKKKKKKDNKKKAESVASTGPAPAAADAGIAAKVKQRIAAKREQKAAAADATAETSPPAGATLPSKIAAITSAEPAVDGHPGGDGADARLDPPSPLARDAARLLAGGTYGGCDPARAEANGWSQRPRRGGAAMSAFYLQNTR